MKRIAWERRELLRKFKDMGEDREYLQYLDEYLKKKHNYKPPKAYAEMMRRPAPTDLPKQLARKYSELNDANESKIKIYDEQF